SIAASTVRLRARVPARWPSATGSPRRSAQRPLPSMMIATVRASSSRCCSSTATGFGAPSASNLHDLGFLALQQLVDLGDVLVAELLAAVLRAVLLVAPGLAVVDELLQMVDRVPAHVADRDLALLRHVPDDLDEILAPLLGQLRDRQADQLAVVRRRQAEVGLLDRPLDRGDRVRVERLDRQHPRLGRADRRQLLERRLLAVVVDLAAVEQGPG